MLSSHPFRKLRAILSLQGPSLMLALLVLPVIVAWAMLPKERSREELTWQSPIEPPGVTIVSSQPQALVAPVAKAAVSRVSNKTPAPTAQGAAVVPTVAQLGLTAVGMSAGDTEQVRKTLERWSAAWSSRDMEAYLGQYAKSFVPAAGQSRAAWEKTRHQRILSKGHITHEVRDLDIVVQGDTATAHFEQMYAADQTRQVGPKTLRLQKENGDWRIMSESTH